MFLEYKIAINCDFSVGLSSIKKLLIFMHFKLKSDNNEWHFEGFALNLL